MREREKYFIFTIDDNIRFFRELTERDCESLFAHPYLALLKKLHERFGLKTQLNCFYGDMDGFDLSKMTDRFRAEWEENAAWLKLSFHSREELPIEPYKDSEYAEVYGDCLAVHNEIERFAGKKSLAETTTVHFCLANGSGVNALKDCGVKGLLGLFGEKEEPRDSYTCRGEESERVRNGRLVEKDGMSYAAIDVVLNLYEPEKIRELLDGLLGRTTIEIMIHEQYFYRDYPYYQSNFAEKLETAVGILTERGYRSVFFEELLLYGGKTKSFVAFAK